MISPLGGFQKRIFYLRLGRRCVMYIRITRDRSNICLAGIYKLDGKLMVMLPGYIVDFPRRELPNESSADVRLSAEDILPGKW